jgi:hypothetical protein
MTPTYGMPSTPAPASASSSNAFRPSCWGKSFDPTNRECRGCPVQSSCQEEIHRLVRMSYQTPQYAAPAPVPAPVPFHLPPTPAPMPAPIPVSYAPQPPHRPAPMQVAPPQPPPVQQPPAMPTYGYGWYPDPMAHYIHAAPPVIRVQQPGETFGERAAKNLVIHVLEALAGSFFLILRQWIWGPPRDRD